MRDTTIRLKLDISDLKAKAAAAAAETKRLEAEVERSNKRSTQRQLRESRNAQRAADKAIRDARRMGAEQRQAFNEIGGAFGRVGLAAAAAGAVSVRAFANFDEGMSAVKATGKDARENIGALRDMAIDMGAKTKFNATESAAAIEEMAKAGVSAKEILGGGLEGALNMAAAGNIEVAEAAGYASQAMNQFGLKGKDVPHIADLLAAAAGKANGEIGDFGQALNQTGIVAAQTGLSLEETTGGLAAFAQSGLLGSDAGTSFKTMLQRLNPMSKEAATLMEKLGLSAYDSQGNFVGLSEYAGRLKTAMKDMTSEQRNAAMQTLFGSDAIRAANVLYNEGESGVRKWIKAVDDQGFAAETASVKMDNLKGDWEEFTGALETALIGTGEGANGPLRELVQNLTSLVGIYNDLPSGAKSAVGGVTALTAVVGGGVWATSRAISSYANMQDNLATLGLRSNDAARGIEVLNRKSMALRGGALAAGVGLAALSSKAEDTHEGLGVLTDTAAGAAIGFGVAGPWGAAIGGGLGLLKGLSGAFSDTAGSAKRAAAEAARTESWDVAKSAAQGLRDALLGTVDAYNEVTAAAVRQGLMGKNGTPVEWVKDLQGAGLSIDTITRAILGQRDAQKLVNESFREQDQSLSELKRKREAIRDQEPGRKADGSYEHDPEAMSKQARDLEKLQKQIEDETGAVAARKKAYEALVGPVAAQAKNEANLAESLGLTKKQYDKIPKRVRTEIEANGLPQTFAGIKGLLKLSGDLDGKQVVSIVRASGADLSRKQVQQLKKQYDLTPDQVRTLMNAVDHASGPISEVQGKANKLDGTRATVRLQALDAATGAINAARAALRSLDGSTATVRVSEVRGGRATRNADGGMAVGGRWKAFANGGFDEFGRPVSRVPQIRSGNQGTVMWGEPETGWEAYVSGKPSQKPRNRAILSEAASRLGGNVEWFADGGFKEAVSSSEYTGLRIRVRDLQRSLREKETVGKGKKKRRRLALRGLDRVQAQQDLAEARAELAEQAHIRRQIGKKKTYRTAGAYNRAMQGREDRKDTAKEFASNFDSGSFQSPASLERALSNMLRDSAEFTKLASDLRKKGASPWLMEQLFKAGPSRATNRTMRTLLADSARFKRINNMSKQFAGGVASSYAAVASGATLSRQQSAAMTKVAGVTKADLVFLAQQIGVSNAAAAKTVSHSAIEHKKFQDQSAARYPSLLAGVFAQ